MKKIKHEEEPHSNIEFDDYLVQVFWKLHRFKLLQWIVLLAIRIREKLDIDIKKPITKAIDDMDNCHFRTLYKRNEFNDNYTDPDFLCSMQLNTNLNYYTITTAISATTRVALRICPCILYFIMYYHLKHEKVSPEAVCGLSFFCMLLGYGILQWCQWLIFIDNHVVLPSFRLVSNATIFTQKLGSIWSDCMVFLCCSGFSYLLVPILRTVTQSVDTRTVYAVCVVMFVVHLLSNDYGLRVLLVSTALSMNSAIFSLICLASRLQTDRACLALMSFGVMSFICYPQWSIQIQSRFHRWTTTVTIALIVIVIIAGYTVSIGSLVMIAVFLLSVVVLSPILYICYVQYKVNILGPWDEARPELHVNMEEIERGFKIRRSKREHSSEESIGELKKQRNNSAAIKKKNADEKEEDSIAAMEAKGIGLIL